MQYLGIKRILRTSLALLALIVAGSCNDYLDADVQGIYTDASFYQTEEHALFALNATYQIASFATASNSLWVFGDVASDDALKGGNAGDQSERSRREKGGVVHRNVFATDALWSLRRQAGKKRLEDTASHAELAYRPPAPHSAPRTQFAEHRDPKWEAVCLWVGNGNDGRQPLVLLSFLRAPRTHCCKG